MSTASPPPERPPGGGAPQGARPARRALVAGASRALWWFASAAVVWTFGLPLVLDLPLAAALAVAAFRLGSAQRASLLLGLLLALGTLEGATRLLQSRGQGLDSFRPHERLVRHGPGRPGIDPPGPRYRAGADIRMRSPHGDLFALEPDLPGALAAPRDVRFVTDRWGFRNAAEYRGQPVLAVGDSFVVGTGNDQEDVLCRVLEREHALPCYSIAYPTAPEHYLAYLRWAHRRLDLSPGTRTAVFFFEGNDFLPEGSLPRPVPLSAAYDQRKLAFHARTLNGWLRGPRAVFNMMLQLRRRWRPGRIPSVEVHTVAGRPVGFYRAHVAAARAPRLRMRGAERLTSDVARRIDAVFLIPEKYRVYAPLIGVEESGSLSSPPAALRALEEAFEPHGVAVVDLTGPLVEQARALAPRGELVFWPDDTHWNVHGIRTAAGVVARTLRSISGPVDPGAGAPQRRKRSDRAGAARRSPG